MINVRNIGVCLIVLGVLLYVTATTVDLNPSPNDAKEAEVNAYNLSISATVFMWVGVATVLVTHFFFGR